MLLAHQISNRETVEDQNLDKWEGIELWTIHAFKIAMRLSPSLELWHLSYINQLQFFISLTSHLGDIEIHFHFAR